MTALEEIKESTRDSLAAKQLTLSRLTETQIEEDSDTVRDLMLDILGGALTMYKITVAEARAAESVDEVARLWETTHAFYASMLHLWAGIGLLTNVADATTESIPGEGPNVRSGKPQSELFAYLKQVIQKLERASAQAHEFHA